MIEPYIQFCKRAYCSTPLRGIKGQEKLLNEDRIGKLILEGRIVSV